MKNRFQYASYHGTDSHLARERSKSTCELVAFSGASIAELISKIQSVLDADEINQEKGLEWISYASQNDFNALHGVKQYRATVVAYGVLELKRQLTQMIKMIKLNPQVPFSHEAAGLYYGFGSPAGKMAFLFPGQGAQYVRMGGRLRDIYPRTQAVWDELGGFSFSGKTLDEVVFPPKPRDKKEAVKQADDLAHVDWSMPAINLVSESIRVLFEAMSVQPDAVAAHSAGDVASYCGAGIISKEQMIRFAGFRGVHVASCPMASRGGILKVFSGPDKIRSVLKENGIKQVWIANYNSPSITVLSGDRNNINSVKEALAGTSIRSKIISVDAATHCLLSLRANNQFMDYIAEESFNKAICKLYSYLFGDALENDPELYKKVISITGLKPVRFTDQINKMYEDGVRTFVELGPSDGLTLFVKEILGDKPHHAFCTNKVKGDDNYHFLSAVAELIKLGRIQDINVLWEGYKAPARPTVLSAADDIENVPDLTAAIAGKELERLKALDLQLSRIDKMASA